MEEETKEALAETTEAAEAEETETAEDAAQAETEVTEDAALEQELLLEKTAKKAAKKAALRTVLGAVCGFAAVTVMLMALALVFRRTPFVLYLGVAPAVWFFTWLFHGDTGKTLRISCAVVCVLVIYFGTCLHDAARYLAYYDMPNLYFFPVLPPVMASRYLLASIPDTMLYAFLFTLTGYLVEWMFHGDPLEKWRKRET